MTATGRHTMANAAPSRRPAARLNVPRYDQSNLEISRPAIDQYASGVTSGVPIGPEV